MTTPRSEPRRAPYAPFPRAWPSSGRDTVSVSSAMGRRYCGPVVDEGGRSLAGDLEQLRSAGLYDPSSPIASQREELLRYLLERLSVEEIVHWAQRTNVFGISARAIDQPPPFVSAVEAATRAGVALETVVDF